jgi:hypothetical protein
MIHRRGAEERRGKTLDLEVHCAGVAGGGEK